MITWSELRSMPVMKAASPSAARRLPWPAFCVTAYSPTYTLGPLRSYLSYLPAWPMKNSGLV